MSGCHLQYRLNAAMRLKCLQRAKGNYDLILEFHGNWIMCGADLLFYSLYSVSSSVCCIVIRETSKPLKSRHQQEVFLKLLTIM